jgi:hypothetical protein
MNTKLVARCLIGLLFICAVMPWGVTPALAGIEPVPWLPTSGGFDNPIFWVLFNPQPEPPGDWFTYSVNSQGEAVFTAQYGAEGLRLMFGVSSLTGLLDNISLSKTVDGFTSLVLSGTQPIYRADFTFDSGGMLFPGSLVAFNPQPEPPGAPYIKQWVTFDLLDAAGGPVPMMTEVNMTMRLTDANGNLVKLEPAPVPEPATVLLFCAGMSFLVGIGIRRKRC